MFFLYNFRITAIYQVSCNKNRLEIFRTKGFHLAKYIVHGRTEICESYFRINSDFRYQQFGWNGGAYYFFELINERTKLIWHHCHSCGREVSAITQQMILARMNSLVKIKSTHTSRASRDEVTTLGEHNCR